MVKQIEESLGSDTELHVEILSIVLKKAYKCPIKRKSLDQRNLVIQDCKHPKEEICTPSAASVKKKPLGKLYCLEVRKRTRMPKDCQIS